MIYMNLIGFRLFSFIRKIIFMEKNWQKMTKIPSQKLSYRNLGPHDFTICNFHLHILKQNVQQSQMKNDSYNTFWSKMSLKCSSIKSETILPYTLYPTISVRNRDACQCKNAFCKLTEFVVLLAQSIDKPILHEHGR